MKSGDMLGTSISPYLPEINVLELSLHDINITFNISFSVVDVSVFSVISITIIISFLASKIKKTLRKKKKVLK